MQFIKWGVILLLALAGFLSSAKALNIGYTEGNNIILESSNNVIMDGTIKAFNAILEEMDNALNVEYTPCTIYEPTRPFFQAEGRRVSEIKCLQHIWDVKVQEETKNKIDLCQATMGVQLSGVVGGRPSKPGEFPHMGAVGWKTEERGKYAFRCGSFLISNRFALTAAHCRQFENKSPAIVRFGVVNIINDKVDPSQRPVDIRIEKFISHPSYRPNFKTFDIAILKLKNRVPFNDNIQPACILSQNIDEAFISGWGLTENDNGNEEKISEHLQMAQVDVLPQKTCRKKWKRKLDKKYWPKFLDSQMCAVKTNGKKADICSGDSGGPLQFNLHVNTKRKIYNVIGITSTSTMCGSLRFPSVYTRVSSFLDWIEEVVWEVKSEPRDTFTDLKPSENENEIDTSDKHVEPEVTSINDILNRISNEIDTSDKQFETTKNTPNINLNDKIVRINDVHEFENGKLFVFDSTKGSKWTYINYSELERNKQE